VIDHRFDLVLEICDEISLNPEQSAGLIAVGTTTVAMSDCFPVKRDHRAIFFDFVAVMFIFRFGQLTFNMQILMFKAGSSAVMVDYSMLLRRPLVAEPKVKRRMQDAKPIVPTPRRRSNMFPLFALKTVVVCCFRFHKIGRNRINKIKISSLSFMPIETTLHLQR
jgi:hypothetical protein